MTAAPPAPRARARLVRIAERGLEAPAVVVPVGRAIDEERPRHLGEDVSAELRRLMARLREVTDPYLA